MHKKPQTQMVLVDLTFLRGNCGHSGSDTADNPPVCSSSTCGCLSD